MNDDLARVYRDALDAGLGEEGARAAVAIAVTEDGYRGAVGDNGQSFGTFQLYSGGQLPNWAASEGMSVEEAKRRLRADPHAANRWALRSYLGHAIARGQFQGLRGPALATHAQRTGQVSVSPERAGENYAATFGGGRAPGLASVARQEGSEMDRPPSEFEAPSRSGGSPAGAGAPASRAGRMQSRIAELRQQRAALQAQVEALLKPGPEEVPSDPGERVSPVFQAQADQARKNRELELAHRRAELNQVDTALRQTETDLANDPDPKDTTKDPMQAEKDRIAVERAAFDLAEARRKAAEATSPAEKRLAELEVRKAELGVKQAEATLDNTLNPRAPQRAPRYPDEVAASEASAAASRASAARTTALLPGEVAKGELDAARARQDLLPKTQQILQGHQDTVKYVQGMLERGEIDQANADAYVALSKQAAESALKGFTPFDEMKLKREAETANKRMGTDLLTQRLSSGAGLASSLLSGATSLAGHAMLRPGQTSLGVDPLAQLMPLLEQLQGGADVTPFARGLLMGGQQGGPPGAQMPLPAGL